MPVEPLPTCQDFQKRFDLFFDGEVDGRTMRALALHVTRCASCEAELRQSERLQEVVAASVRGEIEKIDVPALWRSIESRVDAVPPSRLARLRERWQLRSGLEVRFLAIAASVALAILVTGAFWTDSVEPGAVRVANNNARIDSLSSSAPSVAVWSEPREQTTAIWVASFEP